MDLDIEMDDAAQQAPLVEEEPSHAEDILQPDEPEELGEVIEEDGGAGAAAAIADESKTLVPTKVHIRGLDTLSTDDIRNYVKAHYGPVDRVEWIDDTSANLLFGGESTAREALVALSATEIADPTALAVGEILPAKPVESRPEITLHVRTALQSDRKQPGAAMRSRFYLMNPEYDPEERRRQRNSGNGNGYRDRDHHHHHRRRRDSDRRPPRFEASMYDDAPTRPSRSRSRSRSRDRRRDGDRSYSPDQHRRPYARENRGKELFGGGGSGRRRVSSRSASPRGDRDMDVDAVDDDAPSSSNSRVRARSLRDDRHRNESKELFPSKAKAASGRSGRLDRLETALGTAQLRDEDMPRIVDGGIKIRGAAAGGAAAGQLGFNIKGSAANARELFPGRLGGNGNGSSTNAGKELLDKRPSRRKAEDLFG
ncbi:Protein of unknown function (DUF2414) [Geosmithia morbida]|uniref:Uncharacterized protein n=1 Tax=Geosmithia morbida TaxID=1094350 RepID=A0A9P5D2S8_9HYPO|nr:Protein of unknown function (DUF2414) [Geosmithia morbida]KAF4121786.1 Protein of unknown function (DUF2414) [Geosmithia morbida]